MKLFSDGYVSREFDFRQTMDHVAALAEFINVLEYKYSNINDLMPQYEYLCACAVKTADFTAYGFMDLFCLYGGSSPFACSIAMPDFVWTETVRGRDPLGFRKSELDEDGYTTMKIRKSMRINFNGRKGSYKVHPLRLPEEAIQDLLNDYKGFYKKITQKYPYAFFISPHSNADLSMFYFKKELTE